MATVNSLEDVVQLLDDLAASSALSKRFTDDVKAGKEVLKKIVNKVSVPQGEQSLAYRYELYLFPKSSSWDIVVRTFQASKDIEVVGIIPAFSETGNTAIIYRVDLNKKTQNKLCKIEFRSATEAKDHLISNPIDRALYLAWEKMTLIGIFNIRIK